MSIPTSSVPASVLQARDIVTPAMRAAVGRLCPDMARIASYHHGWTDEFGIPASGSGKSLRPALVLLSAQATGAPAEEAVPAAVAVEFVHNFSLLHDDIMDADQERRHRPTAWTVFGRSAAILAGDALLIEAAAILAEQPRGGGAAAARLMSDTQRLITGQAADLEFERRGDVTLSECLAMVANKTGALFASACAVGAILVEAPAAVVRGLTGFGEHLGLAFQLVDDLLGIWGDPRRTGKPVLADLRSRKKSVPVVVALTAGTGASARLAELYFDPVPLPESELAEAATLIEEAGGRAWTEAEAARHLAAALDCLDRLALPSDVLDNFREIAYFVTDRSW
ncbi:MULTISPECIES: polyprenyl synthetase family protein [Amycolatopsis]|uniref:Polyprenyl synthetase family protein n=1 Tax=Amycolatopsis albidoflavus TaxID=102226 RepID=A0ABW5IAL2_9PSEU